MGTTVLVRNKRGTQISARVVSQINAEQGLLEVWNRVRRRTASGHFLGNNVSIQCLDHPGKRSHFRLMCNETYAFNKFADTIFANGFARTLSPVMMP
jgi:hypothetical protein